ncbi:mediator of RNA polymerase II transcription subunit 10 [Podospora appendiculata]|uniref:Mediator of RNA polymerase II transcription subunit 10 n=1 Tax=Podospora appendiculata TaxID=314037 RepID=A0AAE0X1K2_9PEZI|nr:mediator of RNA polymerase II transcription subunit 10 [Podospora appendiculata]
MAPVTPGHLEVQENVKNVIQDLFQVMAQVSNYDSAGRPSKEALANDLQTLDKSLLAVYRSSAANLRDAAGGGPGIPEPLIQYVENGRNPDIYTREFVELVRRLNQLARGKMHAFRDFRDVLAHEMDAAMPELREDVRRTVEATGGPGPGPAALGVGAGATTATTTTTTTTTTMGAGATQGSAAGGGV